MILRRKNRIQVSNIMKPLFFYVNLAKRYMQQYDDVELSVLGMEIMKNNGFLLRRVIISTGSECNI
ncbi:hypothetical protein YC2023_042181 [Brassica napus]